jgi:hypothetical protein
MGNMLKKDLKSPYVDYQYYRDTFHGSAMTEAEFPNAEIEAEAFVNAVTFGRLRRLDKIPDCVKDAICSAADVMGEYSKGMESDISSESNDGYSVTYKAALKSEECEKSMKAKVKRHLSGTGLMYGGRSRIYDN